jgi:phosphohistidine phosphatase
MAGHTLFVLRHAKSSWDDPGLDDHDRPLAPRGRRTVKMLAAHVQEAGIAPVLVLCSSARRTVETLQGVAPGGETLIEDELYSASGGALIDRLRRVPEEVESVMVIGHNPALQTLVLRLAGSDRGRPDDPDLADVRRKFPTGALATITVACAWSELGPGRGELSSYIRPKSLH